MLLLLPALPARSSESVSAIPATMEHRLATMPYIAGTVVSVTSQQMVVNTDQGESVEIAMDSRTLRPSDLDKGMNMRVEFRILENGQYYAERIVPMRGGSVKGGEMATADESSSGDQDSHVVAAGYTPATNGTDAQSAQNADPSAQNQGTPATPSTPTTQDQGTTPTTSTDASTSTTDDPKKLPKTATARPLMLLLAVIAFAFAGVSMYVRRKRTA
jgi:uncharacterized surface anchored protein